MTLALNGMSLERRYGVVAQPLQRLEIGPFLRGAHSLVTADPRLAAFEQVGAEGHFRYDFAHSFGVGDCEVCALSEGMFLQLIDAEAARPVVLNYTSPDLLHLRIASEGVEAIAPMNGELTVADGPSSLIVIEPADPPPTQMAFAGRQRSVHLFADRHALREFCGDRELELPAVLRAFLDGTLQARFIKRAAIKPEALRCLEDLQRCEHEGWARTLFMRSKAIELFCHLLKLLEQDEGFGAPEASQVTSRGVLRAQRILKSRYVSPPSLDDLAREVGVSRSGLCAGFRQLLGKSIFGYIQDLRMERALTLLNETQTSITEIAHAIGYSHLSNFTVAVQRRFGMSPKELRRNASGVDTPQ